MLVEELINRHTPYIANTYCLNDPKFIKIVRNVIRTISVTIKVGIEIIL